MSTGIYYIPVDIYLPLTLISMKLLRNIVAALLAAMSLVSCVDQILHPCGGGTYTLHFRYHDDDTGNDIFHDKIGNIVLFIYDADNLLVKVRRLSKEDLENQQIKLKLEKGQHHAVAWGNFNDATTAESFENMLSGIIGVSGYFSQEAINTSDSLHYGLQSIHVEDFSNDTIYFECAHINMILDLPGLKDEAMPGGECPIRFKVRNLSPTVDFQGNCSDDNVSYFPETKPERDGFTARFNTLRYSEINNITVELYYQNFTKEPIYVLRLADFIAENDIRINGVNHVTVGIQFIVNGFSIDVKKWGEEELTPGL